MARPFTPRVGRHVTYYRTSSAKPVSAQITAVGSTNGGIVLMVSGQTIGDATTGVLRRAEGAARGNNWRPA